MTYNAIFLKRVSETERLQKTLKTISLIVTVDYANDSLKFLGFHDVTDILSVSRFITNVYLSSVGIN